MVGDMLVENNLFYNNGHYGIDQHTGTHDMIIRNNTVYGNNGTAIICSLDYYNILIEKNKVYNNTGSGITFSRNMTNSVDRNNFIHNQMNEIPSLFQHRIIMKFTTTPFLTLMTALSLQMGLQTIRHMITE